MSTAISSQIKDEFKTQLGTRVKFDEPLAPYLAYQIGGPADILVFPETEADLVFIKAQSEKHQLPLSIVGRGTNLLVRDGGIRGITVGLGGGFKNIEVVQETSELTRVRSGGGVEKPALLEWAINRGLTGLEFSAGVPGSIGGGIFMNAGTKYGSYGDILRELRLFDFVNGPRQFATDKAMFGYREQKAVKGTLVVWAEFELRPGNKIAIRTEVDRIILERALKQPLDFPSCGSTFKNPEGFSAGRLIEKAGLKGTKAGGAEISLKHANFILNKKDAKAADILTLIELCQRTVREKFSVDLECEVIILGND